jgi:class 3 adenylate cyclase
MATKGASGVESAQRAVLFADVCDSTAIYETLGDQQALSLINTLFEKLGAITATHEGIVIKTLGDAVVCQFRDADKAFRAACDMQTSAASLSPRSQAKFAIKISFNYGSVVLKDDDLFGDTVNVCSRLNTLGGPEQVLTTQQTVDALTPGLRVRCRQLYPLKVKGKAEQITVFDVLWRLDPDITERDLPARPPASRNAVSVLKISYGGESFTVGPAQEVLLGRDKGNDIIIESTRASRVHARIFGRDGNFVIADQSSNGTFLLIDGNSREMLLRREEAVMGERGWVGVGKSAEGHGTHVLRYRLERKGA